MEMLGGGTDGVAAQCRTPDIMADAAYAILTKPAEFTGNFVIDDKILADEGISDFDQYAVSPGTPLILDFFLEDNDVEAEAQAIQKMASSSTSAPSDASVKIEGIFKKVQAAG